MELAAHADIGKRERKINCETQCGVGTLAQKLTEGPRAKGIGKSVVPKENRTLADLGLDKKTSLLAHPKEAVL
jgi:hypothetical protein